MKYFEYYKNLLSSKDFEKLEKVLDRPFRKSIRVNTLKISVEDFKKIAKEKKWELQSIPWCKEGFFIDREDHSNALGKDFLHHTGFFYVQEAASMIPVEMMSEIKDDDYILDLAAAPGSKFTQISAKAKNTTLVVANEPSGSRIKGLASNIQRLGIRNSTILKHDPSLLAKFLANTFTKVSLDAPCSGDGMIRRDKKTLDRWSFKKVKFQAGIQKRLIKEAFKLLKPGGELIYSTCTLTKEEDEEVISHLLENFDTAKLEKFRFPLNPVQEIDTLRLWPYMFNTEGFFVSKITKTDETKQEFYKNTKDRNAKKRWSYLPRKKEEILKNFLFENFGLELAVLESEVLIEKNDEVWIWPRKIFKLKRYFDPVFSGVCLGKWTSKGFVPSHSLASYFGLEFTKNVINLAPKEAKDFLYGKDLSINSDNKFTLIKSDNYIIGFAKSFDNKLKNVLPRDLIIN